MKQSIHFRKLFLLLIIVLCLIFSAEQGACEIGNKKKKEKSKTQKAKFFDVRVNDTMYEKADVIKPWKTITLDSLYAGSWIVSGDIDNDGEPEIVSARNVDIRDSHYTSSVIVYNLDGSVLWKWGDASIGRNILHHDVACQIYDWDGNGTKDVIVATNKYLVELDGVTGKVKREIGIPNGASDCIVFANLGGNKRASDVLIKNRYGKIWALNSNGEILWNIELPAGKKTAHQPVLPGCLYWQSEPIHWRICL